METTPGFPLPSSGLQTLGTERKNPLPFFSTVYPNPCLVEELGVPWYSL